MSRVWITGPTPKDAYFVVWCSEHGGVSSVAALPGRLREARAIAQRHAREHRADDKRAIAIKRDIARSNREIARWAREHGGRRGLDEFLAQLQAKRGGHKR